MRNAFPHHRFVARALLAGLLCAGGIGGCASDSSDKDLPQRIDAPTASRRIAALVRAREPYLARDATFPVEETTPPALWNAMYTQTFRVTDGLFQRQSFALTRNDAAQIGASFGGPGIVATHVGDTDHDGRADFLYASGSDSGITRFEINLLDRPGGNLTGKLRQRRIPFSYRDPVRFVTSAGQLEVWDVRRNLLLGHIEAMNGVFRFLPEPDLPRGVRERFFEPRL